MRYRSRPPGCPSPSQPSGYRSIVQETSRGVDLSRGDIRTLLEDLTPLFDPTINNLAVTVDELNEAEIWIELAEPLEALVGAVVRKWAATRRAQPLRLRETALDSGLPSVELDDIDDYPAASNHRGQTPM